MIVNLNKKLVIFLSATGMLLVVAIAIIGFTTQKKASQAEESFALYKLEKSEDLSLVGKVHAKQQQQVVYNQALGEVKQINVTDGQEVKSGDVLVTYSSADNQYMLSEKQTLQNHYTANIVNLENQLAVANERLRKAKWNENEAEKQAAETDINSIESSLSSYRDQLTDVNAQIQTLQNTTETVIVANFDGMVAIDDTKKTDATAPMAILYSHDLIIKSSVTEYDRDKLSKDQAVAIKYGNQSKTITGTVSAIGAIPVNGESSISSYSVEFSPEECIPLGYSIDISVEKNDLYIPKTAVKKIDEKNYVYLFNKNKVKRTQVTVEEDGEVFKVLEGLKTGDTIVKNYEEVLEPVENSSTTIPNEKNNQSDTQTKQTTDVSKE